MKQGEIKPIMKGKTPYNASYTVIDGQVVPLSLTKTELNAAILRGEKHAELMPELTPFEGVGVSRAPHGFTNIMELGCIVNFDPNKNENKWDDATRRIQEYLDNLPDNTKPRLYIPSLGEHGFFGWESIIVRKNKGLMLIGDEGLPYLYQEGIASKLKVGKYYAPRPAIIFEKGSLPSTVKDLFIHGEGSAEKSVAGIYCETIVEFQRVYSERFTQGFWFQGSAAAEGSNTSMSVVTDCRAAHNKGDGFVAVGYDGNRIRFTGIISVDNDGYGWLDDSFLGCTWIAHQTENNRKGGWAIRQATAQAMVYANYDEGGQPANYITPDNGTAIIIEGQNPNGYTGSRIGEPHKEAGGKIFRGATTNREITGYLQAASANIGGLNIAQSQSYGEGLKLDLSAGGIPFITFAQAGVPTQQIGEYSNALPTGKRDFVQQVTVMNGARLINGVLYMPGTPEIEGQVFYEGDHVQSVGKEWICTKAGRNATMEAFVIESMDNVGGAQDRQRFTLMDKSGYAKLKQGDYLNFSEGAVGQIHTIHTQYKVEVTRPVKFTIHEGNRVDYFGNLYNYLMPVGYTTHGIQLNYEPISETFTAGQKVIVDKLPSKVVSVKNERGVLLVELALPEGGEPGWFAPGNGISFNGQDRMPMYWNWDEKNPSVTIGFPTAGLAEGAVVQLGNELCTVRKVEREMVTVSPVKGRLLLSGKGSTYTIQRCEFKAL